MSGKQKLFIALGFLLVLIIGLMVWIKQPAPVTQKDLDKAEEVASDDDLMDAIETGTSGDSLHVADSTSH